MQDDNSAAKDKSQSKPYQVRLPGFVVDEAVGLGDAVQRVTYAMGIKPCGGCERRFLAIHVEAVPIDALKMEDVVEAAEQLRWARSLTDLFPPRDLDLPDAA